MHADWLVLVALGTDWTEAIPFIRLLAVFTLVEPVASIVAAAMIANGHPSALLRWNLISFAIICISSGLGAIWGATGIVAAFAISGISLRLLGFLNYAAGYLPMSTRSMVNVFQPYVLIVPVLVVALLLVHQILKELSPFPALLISVLFSMVLYLVLIFIVTETRREARGIIDIVIRRTKDTRQRTHKTRSRA
jgi:PST family polysaccharide transporter